MLNPFGKLIINFSFSLFYLATSQKVLLTAFSLWSTHLPWIVSDGLNMVLLKFSCRCNSATNNSVERRMCSKLWIEKLQYNPGLMLAFRVRHLSATEPHASIQKQPFLGGLKLWSVPVVAAPPNPLVDTGSKGCRNTYQVFMTCGTL